tara:strand:+ start:5488 stop:6288 length:801 start_codon:yes stop_codon:yes gene_type:complete
MNNHPMYIVMYSGGLTSFESARRAIEKHGHENVRLWFADTNTEDEDLYRFNSDVEKLLNHKIEVLDNDGLDVWDIFYKRKFIGNTRKDPCSHFLKRRPLRRKLEIEYPNPDDAIVVIGMDEHEDCTRIEKAVRAQLPYKCWMPLLEEPLIMKAGITRWLNGKGVEIPRLYKQGFQHNNCGGFCIKAGIGQFVHLQKTNPERYDYHMEKEQEFRKITGKDVSILRDRRNYQTKPLTLLKLKERISNGENWNYDVGWSCMCFISDSEE